MDNGRSVTNKVHPSITHTTAPLTATFNHALPTWADNQPISTSIAPSNHPFWSTLSRSDTHYRVPCVVSMRNHSWVTIKNIMLTGTYCNFYGTRVGGRESGSADGSHPVRCTPSTHTRGKLTFITSSPYSSSSLKNAVGIYGFTSGDMGVTWVTKMSPNK